MFLFDSHSNDCYGQTTAIGFSTILKFKSKKDLEQYIVLAYINESDVRVRYEIESISVNVSNQLYFPEVNLKHEYYKEQDSKRKSTEYQKAKCRERNATETQIVKGKKRKTTETAKAKNRAGNRSTYKTFIGSEKYNSKKRNMQ